MMSASTTETVTGIGVGILIEGWSLWNSYGKDILTAGLDLLRSKVVTAAASARVGAVSPARPCVKTVISLTARLPAPSHRASARPARRWLRSPNAGRPAR